MENKIKLVQENNLLIVYFYGEVDSTVVASYRMKITSALEEQMMDVVFDYSNSTFIDSSGIGLVLGRYNLLKEQGYSLTISNLNKTAYRLFELTGIFKIMEYKESSVC